MPSFPLSSSFCLRDPRDHLAEHLVLDEEDICDDSDGDVPVEEVLQEIMKELGRGSVGGGDPVRDDPASVEMIRLGISRRRWR